MGKDVGPPFATVGYVLGGALMLISLTELGLTSWPWRVLDVNWRFGAVGLYGNGPLWPLVGFGMVVFAAYALEQRKVLRGLSLLAGVVSLFLFFLALRFGLDVAQLRGMVRADALVGYDVIAGKVLFNLTVAAVAMAWVGFTGWSATRYRGGAHRKSRPTASLVATESVESSGRTSS
jgi:hypothetical protein